jgi:hypothetical protein
VKSHLLSSVAEWKQVDIHHSNRPKLTSILNSVNEQKFSNSKTITTMIDSIHIRLHKAQLSQQQLNRVISITKPIKMVATTDGEVRDIRGYKNFHVTVNPTTVTVHGSLTKFVLGHNIYNISYEQTRTALYQLQDELGIPILRGELARIDIGECFLFNINNPVHFFNGLLDTPDYERSTGEKLSHCVKYKQDNVLLTFYNKTHEAVMTPRVAVPSGHIVIRVELRIMKNVRRTLINRSPRFAVAYLLSYSFYRRLAQLWCKHYDNIIKRRIMKRYPAMQTPMQYTNYLLTEAIQQKGVQACFNELQVIADDNNWDTRTLSMAKQRVLEHYSNGNSTESRTKPYKINNDPAPRGGYIRQLASTANASPGDFKGSNFG